MGEEQTGKNVNESNPRRSPLHDEVHARYDTGNPSPYPPVEVAVALAARSHALSGSTPASRARLAFVVALGSVENWSEATRAAHAMREIDWPAIARYFRAPISRLQMLAPALLLRGLREALPPTLMVKIEALKPSAIDQPRAPGR